MPSFERLLITREKLEIYGSPPSGVSPKSRGSYVATFSIWNNRPGRI